jgi:uncharacterized repeat protein (TIGR02543 family)
MKTQTHLLKAIIMAALATTLVPATHATLFQYIVHFDGPSESPANASPGIGDGTVSYDSVTHFLTLQAVFSGLTGTTTASHIHAATSIALSGTAGVATTTPNFVGFPLGVTSGSFGPTNLDMTLAASYNPAYVTANGGITAGAEAALTAAMAAGKAYWNIHTSTFGGGEIRGFLIPVTNYTLTITTNGNGSISPGSGTYPSGSNVVLTATPNAGYAFSGWSGDATGTNNPLSVPMTSNKAVTGSFIFATNSVPASIALAAQISWLASNGVNYQVQSADVINSNVWINLGSQIAGNGATNYYYDVIGNVQSRFYRVMTRP